MGDLSIQNLFNGYNKSSDTSLDDGGIYFYNKQNQTINSDIPYNIFINGMITDSQTAISNFEQIVDENSNNILIYNGSDINREDSFFTPQNIIALITDTASAVAGKYSFGDNLTSEKSVESVVSTLKNLSQDDNAKINIIAHSQGTIILRNAIEELKSSLSEEEFQKINDKINISLLGTATRDFPSDVKVTEFTTSLDAVSLMGGVLFCNDNYNVKISDSTGHDFSTYASDLKNNLFKNFSLCEEQKEYSNIFSFALGKIKNLFCTGASYVANTGEAIYNFFEDGIKGIYNWFSNLF